MADLPSQYPPGGLTPSQDGKTPAVTDPLDYLSPKSNSSALPSSGSFASEGFESFSSMSAPAGFRLSSEEQVDMRRRIRSVFEEKSPEADQSEASEMDVDDDEEEDDAVDLEDRRQRTERLREVLGLVKGLWWSGYEGIVGVGEGLADGSRDPKWRVPLGDSGVLDFFLQLLGQSGLLHALKIHVLRLIGNSCADTDENRARVVASNSLHSINFQLQDTSLLSFTIPVLYNICVDYEPAQQLASDSLLGQKLIKLLSSPAFNESRAFLGYTCKILDLLISRPTEVDLAPENTVIVLLKIAIDRESPCDMEDFLALVNTSITYMKHERFQKALVTLGGLDIALTVLIDSYTRFDSHPSIGADIPDEDDAKLLSQMRTALNQVLSDVSALPEFKEACPVVSPFTASLRRWLSSPQLQLQVCACIMLGNLARSDAACEEFVHTSQVHKPLISILKDATDSQLLHAAIGFLKNLAMPMKNKEIIGDAGCIAILPRLWLMDTLQQIQFSSISLARQLINGTFENVRRVCKRLSDDKASPANMRTNLSILISLFDRTDIEPVKMEISRLVTAICRVYSNYTGRTPENMEYIRKNFFKIHPDVGRPLSFMVSQTKWPVVRSEGWFVFALMSRYPDGAKCISDLMNDVTVFHPLVELLTGKDIIDPEKPSSLYASPSATNATSPGQLLLGAGQTPGQGQVEASAQPHAQAAEMNRLDRENALVLVNEMLKNRGTEMAVMRRTTFEDLLKGGGELVRSYRESRPEWDEGEMVPRESRAKAGLNVQELAAESFREVLG